MSPSYKKRKICDSKYDNILGEINTQKGEFKVFMDNMKQELRELRNYKNDMSQKISKITKSMADGNKQINKLHKKATELLEANTNLKNKISELSELYFIEKELREHYANEVDALEHDLENQERHMLELEVYTEELASEKSNLTQRLSSANESRVAILEEDSSNLKHIQAIVKSDEGISDTLKKICNKIYEIEECTGLKERLDENLCIVCKSQNAKSAFIPCGHLCTCLECAGKLDKCPYCRADIERHQPIFSI